jgi:hypothetical protein
MARTPSEHEQLDTCRWHADTKGRRLSANTDHMKTSARDESGHTLCHAAEQLRERAIQ